MTIPIFDEPYFIPANTSSFLRSGETWIQNNQQFRQAQKYRFYRNAMDYIVENDLKGSYFEFGVHRARTFTMIMSLDKFYANHKGGTGGLLTPQEPGGGYMDRYVAFDSFEGFPPGTSVEAHPHYVEGHVKTDVARFQETLVKYGQTLDRVSIVKGFYSESLNEDLHLEFRKLQTKVCIATFDCNLYESYKVALAFTDEYLQPGTVIYLDDYNTHRGQPTIGPKRAWLEYTKRSKWLFEPFLNVGWAGMSFITCERS